MHLSLDRTPSGRRTNAIRFRLGSGGRRGSTPYPIQHCPFKERNVTKLGTTLARSAVIGVLLVTASTVSAADPDPAASTPTAAASQSAETTEVSQRSSSVTQVRKKDGQVVEGTIQGVIVQRSVETTSEDAKIVYRNIYHIWTGKNISLIGEKGVEVNQGSPMLVAFATSRDKPIKDPEIVKGVLALLSESKKGIALSAVKVPSGAEVVIAGSVVGKNSPVAAKLIGSVRGSGETMLRPDLTMLTETGPITVPLTEVIDFK